MSIVKVVLLNISVLFILVGVVGLIKNAVTYHNFNIISDAIYKYSIDAIEKAAKNGTILDGVEYEVTYDDMRDYNTTFFRIFDWGYENILPKDKFEIIKPYIHK